MKPPMVQLPIGELAQVMESAKVRQIMATEKRHHVTVDYFPSREAWTFARAAEGDEPAHRYPEKPISLTFVLEDAMFGGVIYAAITCGGRVVLSPFPWNNYEHLGNMQLVTKKA